MLLRWTTWLPSRPRLRSARAAGREWNGAIKVGNAPCVCSSSGAARECRLTKARFCECGGRLRYRDARRYSMPGIRGGHRWVCLSCGTVKTRWAVASPVERERERDQSRRASAKYRARIRAIIAEAKNRACADCGRHFPTCVMDFDHVRGEKKFKVAEAVQRAYGLNFDRLRAEIAKCDVVCANCHRIRTASRGYAAERSKRRASR
jgi:hypothetical protein